MLFYYKLQSNPYLSRLEKTRATETYSVSTIILLAQQELQARKPFQRMTEILSWKGFTRIINSSS